MVFLSICTALHDYAPQGDNELAINEGELIFVLEKSTTDDWWKAKKRAPGEVDDEPVGLIPNNYIEEARPTHHAKALYDYTRQTEEEISFSEDSALSVYDTSDPDWTLVGLDGEFGFVPANYIEISGEVDQRSPTSVVSPQLPPREAQEVQTGSTDARTPSFSGPAAVLAGIMHRQAPENTSSTTRSIDSQPSHTTSSIRRPQYTPEESDEEPPSPPAPSLPQRPASQQFSPPITQYASSRQPEPPEPLGVTSSPPYNRVTSQKFEGDSMRSSPSGFHLYTINEIVTALGKKKKMPTTLGLNVATGNIMIAPEKSRDGPQQQWTAEKLTHYSIEGKHVFLELVRPSKSVDFHAGANDTAQEIVSSLGEIAGAVRAEGLREVLAASAGSKGGQKKGRILYDFMAQGDDEITVAVDDEVIIVDNTKSNEWWIVRRLKNGNEGVVPSSYVEETGTTTPVTDPSLKAARSIVEQNRLEEERLSKEAVITSKSKGNDTRDPEVGPGVRLPKRGSSLAGPNDNNQISSQRSKRDSKGHSRSGSSSKSKPDASKTRTWTDRSGSFKVEAEFIGLKDGKIHLHKLNGVKIAVSVAKMAIEDLEYVERVTGTSLDDEKPLSDIRRKSLQAAGKETPQKVQSSSIPKSGISKELSKPAEPKAPEYDWFDFFLKSGVNPYQCERYAFNFNRDSMDESILPDITPTVLRTLGLKEGDILRVTKYLDSKYGRTGAKSKLRNVSFSAEEVGSPDDEANGSTPTNGANGGLFSGPGGALRNNTRKGRPAPAIQNDDIVDAETFKQRSNSEKPEKGPLESTSLALVPVPEKKPANGFDDDAWDVKPSRKPSISQPSKSDPTPATTTPSQPPLTGALAELSLLSAPLQPTVVHSAGGQPTEQTQPLQHANIQPPSLPQQSANSFVSPQGGQQVPSTQQQPVYTQIPLPVSHGNQQVLQGQSPPQQNVAHRQRPQAPQIIQQGSLMPPPPPRPLSAPQNTSQNSSFGLPPLLPQLTGAQNQVNYQNRITPPGQSLNDLDQLRLQQQYTQNQYYVQTNGLGQQNPGFAQYGSTIPLQHTAYGQQFQAPQQLGFQNQPQPLQQLGFQNQQQFLANQQTGSPFADPRQQQQAGSFQPLTSQVTGYQPQHLGNLQNQQGGSSNTLFSPAITPQIANPNTFGTSNTIVPGRPGFGQPPPPIPPQSLQPVTAPLIPQKTGPAPPIRFGVGDTKKLIPQPTGRRANLSHATPQNPFGF